MIEYTRKQADQAFSAAGDVRLEPRNAGQAAVAMTHPQWGGYCFPCVVEYDRPNEFSEGFPCFDVVEFSDGEFPTEIAIFDRHYCMPEQLVEFAISIMEHMRADGHQTDAPEQLIDFAERLHALTKKPPSAEAPEG